MDGAAEGWDILTLYTQKLSDSMLHLFLSPKAANNPQLIYTLVGFLLFKFLFFSILNPSVFYSAFSFCFSHLLRIK